MAVKKRIVIDGVEYKVNTRAIKRVLRRMRKIIRRFEKRNAKNISMISIQDEWLYCFDEYIKKYHKERRK